jgi:hypothetical protein
VLSSKWGAVVVSGESDSGGIAEDPNGIVVQLPKPYYINTIHLLQLAPR